MRIYVLADEERRDSSLLLSKYLQRRVGNQAIVDFGDASTLALRDIKGSDYTYVLNLGTLNRVVSSFETMNNTVITRGTFRNRLLCRNRARAGKLAVPEMRIKHHNITSDMYPMLARKTSQGEDDIKVCHTGSQLHEATELGYTHFVKQVLHCKTYRVHVFAPKLNISEVKPSEFKVIKMSQLVHLRKLNFMGVDLRKIPGHYFGSVVSRDNKVKLSLRKAAQNLMHKFKLHWATITYVIGIDGVPMLVKVDGHVQLKEDQNGLLPLYSKAFCEMLGLDVNPLIQRNPRKYV